MVVCAAVSDSYVDTDGCAGGAAAGQGERPLLHLQHLHVQRPVPGEWKCGNPCNRLFLQYE